MPVEARTDAQACSARCRAKASRAQRLAADERAELHVRASAWLSTAGGKAMVEHNGVRFSVTAHGNAIEVKQGRRLYGVYTPNGNVAGVRLAPRVERAIYEEISTHWAARLCDIKPAAVRLARQLLAANSELAARVERGEVELEEAARQAGLLPG
jgi:hypothetical protein